MSDTTDQSTSSRLRALFKSALEDYETKTKIPLDKHPLAKQLENCNSVGSITGLLQDQARAFGKFRGRDRIMRSIERTISFLYKLSTTAALGDDLGLVRLKTLTTFHVLTLFCRRCGLRRQYKLASVSYSTYVPL
jgi:hypothetical protein